uniref:uncharacterized protein n=1 Tax=Myxine glutinosa TaxID=7769 RepID=UPI00358E62D1
MAHKRALEALDRTLQDWCNCKAPMGGDTVLLSGDFRQTLPVIPRGTRADEIRACLKSSFLWHHVKTMTLSTNMRARLFGDQLSAQFAQNLLQRGEGAILAQKNTTVNAVNEQLLPAIPGDSRTYKSVDTVVDQSEVVIYPTEFPNSLEPPGLPPHRLELKVGTPIMLLCNFDQPRLCNGTRLVVKKLMRLVIEATILTGSSKGEDVVIPRIPLIPSDRHFQFKRLQFPVRVSFAMSINKYIYTSRNSTEGRMWFKADRSCVAALLVFLL